MISPEHLRIQRSCSQPHLLSGWVVNDTGDQRSVQCAPTVHGCVEKLTRHCGVYSLNRKGCKYRLTGEHLPVYTGPWSDSQHPTSGFAVASIGLSSTFSALGN